MIEGIRIPFLSVIGVSGFQELSNGISDKLKPMVGCPFL